MNEGTKLKTYRLTVPQLFSLEKNKLYLATETNAGYTIKVGDKDWIGLPKRIVERSHKIFKPYDRNEHREYRRNLKSRRPRVFNHSKPASNV